MLVFRDDFRNKYSFDMSRIPDLEIRMAQSDMITGWLNGLIQINGLDNIFDGISSDLFDNSVILHEIGHHFVNALNPVSYALPTSGHDWFKISTNQDSYKQFYDESISSITAAIVKEKDHVDEDLNNPSEALDGYMYNDCYGSGTNFMNVDYENGELRVHQADVLYPDSLEIDDPIAILQMMNNFNYRQKDVTTLLWDIWDTSPEHTTYNIDELSLKDRPNLYFNTMLNSHTIHDFCRTLYLSLDEISEKQKLYDLAFSHHIKIRTTPRRTWHVNSNGSGDFNTIKDAVESDSLDNNDIILVSAGTYIEQPISSHKKA